MNSRAIIRFMAWLLLLCGVVLTAIMGGMFVEAVMTQVSASPDVTGTAVSGSIIGLLLFGLPPLLLGAFILMRTRKRPVASAT